MIEPGYYRIVKSKVAKDDEIIPGDIAICAMDEDDNISAVIGDGTYHYTLEEFVQTFVFEPRGAEIIARQITEAMQEVHNANELFASVNDSLLGVNPHVTESSSSTAMVPSGRSMAETKKAITQARNNIAKTRKAIAAKTEKLEMLVQQQATALEIKANALGAMIAKAEEAIWSINLYLGKEEKIIQIREGEPAPQEDPIYLRQSVLYMDEECAVAAADGGIGVNNIEEFDKWIVKQKKYVQQVIPESKCVLAMHIRRNAKCIDGDDPWAAANKACAKERWTYFLIRNGDNLYRVFTDIILTKSMFPTKLEFEDFYKSRWGDKKVIRPGDREYMKCLKKEEDREKHYMRVLLILQGLLDRTEIFKPFPDDIPRINICDRDGYDRYLQFIYDGENLLGDGHVSFSEWHKDVNSKLDVGCRVIGRFDDWQVSLHGSDCYSGRIYPYTAKAPKAMRLHVIEDNADSVYSDNRAFVIRYARDGESCFYKDRWGCWMDHEPKVRARCKLYARDDFILNFDAVTIADCEYYINSRSDRHNYMRMIPLLRMCIALKKEEIKDEAPFRQLLIGEIMKKYDVSQEIAEEHIDELIKWWKFKNKTHRALSKDDSKAIRMIVSEFKSKIKRESERDVDDEKRDEIVRAVDEYNKDKTVILVAHKSGNKHVAYVAHNRYDVWVSEQTWTRNKTTGAIYLNSEKQWKFIDKRYITWDIFHTHDRWDEWIINPARKSHLTDPEIDGVVKEGLKLLRESVRKGDPHSGSRWFSGSHDRKNKDRRFKLIAIVVNSSCAVNCFYSSFRPLIPNDLLITNDIQYPVITRHRFRWKRKGDEIEVWLGSPNHDDLKDQITPGKEPWAVDYYGKSRDCKELMYERKNIDLVNDEVVQVSRLKDEKHRMRNRYDYVRWAVLEHTKEAAIIKAFNKYILEGGDTELWEDEKPDNLERAGMNSHDLDKIVDLAAERDVELVGMTLGDLFEMAKDWGWKRVWDADLSYYDRSCAGRNMDSEFNELPMDYVIQPKPIEEEELDDEEDLTEDDFDESTKDDGPIIGEILDIDDTIVTTTVVTKPDEPDTDGSILSLPPVKDPS